MAAHEEKPWPPTGINLSAYKDLAVAADRRCEPCHYDVLSFPPGRNALTWHRLPATQAGAHTDQFIPVRRCVHEYELPRVRGSSYSLAKRRRPCGP